MASILLIDDDDDVRPTIAAMLARGGHDIRQAENGVQGLEMYRFKPADLVLTDLVMPEKEGLATILELRKINSAVKIIAMSGGFAYDPKLYLHMATRFGADRVLRKPFSPTELLEAIQATLDAPPHVDDQTNPPVTP